MTLGPRRASPILACSPVLDAERVKSRRVCGADSRGCACASPVIDLPAGKIPVHSDEMAYICYTVPMDGAVGAMLPTTLPVYCFKHGVWMELRTDVGGF
jgi:hypothetical protein